MKAITQEYIEKIRKGAPNFIKAVDDQKEEGQLVIFMLDAFINEPDLLYACLWYAYSNGVEVRMIPPTPEQLKKLH